MSFLIVKIISFLRNFIKGEKENRYSTKRFAFMIQGAYYALIDSIGFTWFLYVKEYSNVMDLIYFNGWLVVIFGGFVSGELVAKVIMTKYNKNDVSK